MYMINRTEFFIGLGKAMILTFPNLTQSPQVPVEERRMKMDSGRGKSLALPSPGSRWEI